MKPAHGTVASLHLHPAESGAPLAAVAQIKAVASKGIAGDQRYFARISRRTRQPSRRQVTLIEREILSRHAATLHRHPFQPGEARANIETEGIDLAATVGHNLRVGSILLAVIEHREPCAKMDAIEPGLRALMTPPCQGVIATVIESGEASVGDPVIDCGPSS
jgi:MOSC domain-containing protein YiiM